MSKFEVNIDNYTDEQKAQLRELIKIGQEPQRSIFNPIGDIWKILKRTAPMFHINTMTL